MCACLNSLPDSPPVNPLYNPVHNLLDSQVVSLVLSHRGNLVHNLPGSPHEVRVHSRVHCLLIPLHSHLPSRHLPLVNRHHSLRILLVNLVHSLVHNRMPFHPHSRRDNHILRLQISLPLNPQDLPHPSLLVVPLCSPHLDHLQSLLCNHPRSHLLNHFCFRHLSLQVCPLLTAPSVDPVLTTIHLRMPV
jgi:hypothetical protein